MPRTNIPMAEIRRHNRPNDCWIVGEAAVTMKLGEVGKHLIDIVQRMRSAWMAGHQDLLPGAKRGVNFTSEGLYTFTKCVKFVLTFSRSRPQLQRLDFFEQNPDWFFEFQCLYRHEGFVRGGATLC